MLTWQSVTKWQACPFISVHVSRQLDNQPLQWKSIVLIGLYLLYNSSAGNPWWQIISAPVFDWCFDVSDLQGQTEELVEALLTESNLPLPRLTHLPRSQTSCQTVTHRRPPVKNCFGDSEFTAALSGPSGIIIDRNAGSLFRGIVGCEGDCLPPVSRLEKHTHTCQYKRATINLASDIAQLFPVYS